MTDEQIISLYWQKDERAIQETDKKYGAYLRSIAMHILKDSQDVEECLNDAYFRVWKAIPPTHPDRLNLFLARIMRNLSFNRYKVRTADKRGGKEVDAVLEELEECIPGNLNVEDSYLEKELKICIRQFAEALPERECNLFVRRYFFTESIREIASRYQMSENNVMVSLSRTRKKLKKYLEQEGYYHE